MIGLFGRHKNQLVGWWRWHVNTCPDKGNQNKGRNTRAVMLNRNDKTRKTDDLAVPVRSYPGRLRLLAGQRRFVMLKKPLHGIGYKDLSLWKQIVPTKVNNRIGIHKLWNKNGGGQSQHSATGQRWPYHT